MWIEGFDITPIKKAFSKSRFSESVILGGAPPNPQRGDDRFPSPPLRKVLLISVFDKKGDKGGVGTLLRRLKPHFAFYAESGLAA